MSEVLVLIDHVDGAVRKPTDRNRLLSASRTDASSSTTKTMGSWALARPEGDAARPVTMHDPLRAGAR